MITINVLVDGFQYVDEVYGVYQSRLQFEYDLTEQLKSYEQGLEQFMISQYPGEFADFEETRSLPGFPEIMDFLQNRMHNPVISKALDYEFKDLYKTTVEIFNAPEMLAFMNKNPTQAFIIAFVNYDVQYSGSINIVVK